MAEINILCRQYFRLSDDFTEYKNHLISFVGQFFPNYDKVLSDIDVAREALILGCDPPAAETAILADIAVLRAFNEQLRVIESKIRALSSNVREIKLVGSIPGFGILSAAAFVSEIRDFCNFKSPKKLAAFCGIDPAVVQSGNLSALRLRSLSAVLSSSEGCFIRLLRLSEKREMVIIFNPILVDYYECKIQSKPKNVVLVAVMHKLVRYIFAVLRDEKPFRLITPEEHLKAFEEPRLSPLKMSA